MAEWGKYYDTEAEMVLFLGDNSGDYPFHGGLLWIAIHNPQASWNTLFDNLWESFANFVSRIRKRQAFVQQPLQIHSMENFFWKK